MTIIQRRMYEFNTYRNSGTMPGHKRVVYCYSVSSFNQGFSRGRTYVTCAACNKNITISRNSETCCKALQTKGTNQINDAVKFQFHCVSQSAISKTLPSLMLMQKKLKVAISVRRFITTGGAERYAVEVTRRLALIHEVHVFAQEWTLEGNENIRFHKIPKYFNSPRFINTLVFDFFTSRYVDASFDVIHSHERIRKFDVLTIHCPCFKTFLTRKKNKVGKWLAYLSTAISPRKLAYLWLEKKQFTLNEQRVWLAVSHNVKANVQENYALPDESFRIVYPGVSADFNRNHLANRTTARLNLGVAENELALLFVGTEFKRKGLDALLQAVALARPAPFKLLVAGGGDSHSYTIIADQLGIKDQVIFLGLVSDIERIYVLADIFVLPTLSDPFGMSILEAMASGVATITSCAIYNGCAEIICNGEALLLEHPQNPQEIADALSRLIDDDYRHDLAERGQKLAHQITWASTAKQTQAAYQAVMQTKQNTTR